MNSRQNTGTTARRPRWPGFLYSDLRRLVYASSQCLPSFVHGRFLIAPSRSIPPRCPEEVTKIRPKTCSEYRQESENLSCEVGLQRLAEFRQVEIEDGRAFAPEPIQISDEVACCFGNFHLILGRATRAVVAIEHGDFPKKLLRLVVEGDGVSQDAFLQGRQWIAGVARRRGFWSVDFLPSRHLVKRTLGHYYLVASQAWIAACQEVNRR